MDDVIYRQAAISIPVLPKEHRKAFNSYDDAFETGWNEALSCVNALPSAQQWTPCSEGLPEEPGRYMVTDKDGNVRFGMYSTKIPMWWGGANQPTAWMPMPEPYKEEK